MITWRILGGGESGVNRRNGHVRQERDLAERFTGTETADRMAVLGDLDLAASSIV